jgi:hypothetical protein
MDGLALTYECTSELIEQNAMYNGYHSDTMVSNMIAYGSDGKVFLCAINFPGSWHDGSIKANILPYIRNNIGNYKMCVDQGFPRSGDAHLILVGPMSKRLAKKLAPNLRPYLLQISNIYTSLCQASEWGMRSGLNQISTVFDPEYERYINLSSYDRIKRFYFSGED